MAGEQDWEQLQVGDNAGGFAFFWVHKPCGQTIGSAYTSRHMEFCPAEQA